MNKKSWLVIGIIVLVAFGIYYYNSEAMFWGPINQEVEENPGEIDTPSELACGNSKTFSYSDSRIINQNVFSITLSPCPADLGNPNSQQTFDAMQNLVDQCIERAKQKLNTIKEREKSKCKDFLENKASPWQCEDCIEGNCQKESSTSGCNPTGSITADLGYVGNNFECTAICDMSGDISTSGETIVSCTPCDSDDVEIITPSDSVQVVKFDF